MQDHGMNEVDAKRTAEEELAKDPEFYSKQEGAEGSAQEESMETPGEEYAEGPEEQASEEEMGTEKPIRHLSVSDLGRSHLKPEEKRPRGNPNFKKRY